MHRDGYGFLVPDRPVEGLRGDVYIGRESAQTAMHGDRVVGHHRAGGGHIAWPFVLVVLNELEIG